MNILQKVKNAIKYKLILNVIIYRLRWLGIVISPYYWVQEGLNDVNFPELKGSLEKCTFTLFGRDEIEQIGEIPERKKEKMQFLNRLEKGNKCFGIKHEGDIVAFMWFSFHEGVLMGLTFQLQEHEAYLFDMYTLEAYRGQNIAPHLRYKCYELLRQMGKSKLYSVSEVFNPSAIKFKKKLKAKILKLCLYVELFKRIHWNWTLKVYDDEK